MAATPKVDSIRKVPIRAGAAGTRDTLLWMEKLVCQDQDNPAIYEAARELTANIPQKDHAAEVKALFRFVRDKIAYRWDPQSAEALQYPRTTLSLRAGDCDDKAMLLAALLRSIGISTSFVAGGFARGAYQHVWVRAWLSPARFIALDATEPRPAGWEPALPFKLEALSGGSITGAGGLGMTSAVTVKEAQSVRTAYARREASWYQLGKSISHTNPDRSVTLPRGGLAAPWGHSAAAIAKYQACVRPFASKCRLLRPADRALCLQKALNPKAPKSPPCVLQWDVPPQLVTVPRATIVQYRIAWVQFVERMVRENWDANQVVDLLVDFGGFPGRTVFDADRLSDDWARWSATAAYKWAWNATQQLASVPTRTEKVMNVVMTLIASYILSGIGSALFAAASGTASAGAATSASTTAGSAAGSSVGFASSVEAGVQDVAKLVKAVQSSQVFQWTMDAEKWVKNLKDVYQLYQGYQARAAAQKLSAQQQQQADQAKQQALQTLVNAGATPAQAGAVFSLMQQGDSLQAAVTAAIPADSQFWKKNASATPGAATSKPVASGAERYGPLLLGGAVVLKVLGSALL